MFQGAIFIILVLEIILLVCKDNGDVKAGFQFGEFGRAHRTIERLWSHNQFPVLAKTAPTSQ